MRTVIVSMGVVLRHVASALSIPSIGRFVLASFIASATLIATEPKAHALDPIEIEVGLKGGIATKPDSFNTTPFGFGLGGRAGISVAHFYGGLSAIHYFGSSREESNPSGGTVKIGTSTTAVGPELGYTITALPVVQIRPLVGFGIARVWWASDGAVPAPLAGYEPVDHHDHFYLEPGIAVLVPLGRVYVGADANALLLPGVEDEFGYPTTYVSLSVHGQVGVRF